MLADNFLKDPREVVKTGDVVKVKVLEADLPRKRIALTMKLNEDNHNHQTAKSQQPDRTRKQHSPTKK